MWLQSIAAWGCTCWGGRPPEDVALVPIPQDFPCLPQSSFRAVALPSFHAGRLKPSLVPEWSLVP